MHGKSSDSTPTKHILFFFFFFFPSIRDWSNVKPSVCHSFKGKLITLKQNARGWRIIDFLVVPCRHFRARGLSLRSPLISSFGMLYWIFYFVFFFFFLILLDRSATSICGVCRTFMIFSKRKESCNKIIILFS